MNVLTDNISEKVVDLRAAFKSLSTLPCDERARQAMALAAELLEYAAFEMALDHTPDSVAELIQIAARLERSAQRRGGQQFMDDAGLL